MWMRSGYRPTRLCAASRLSRHSEQRKAPKRRSPVSSHVRIRSATADHPGSNITLCPMPGHIFRIASDRTSVGRVFCRAATVPPKTHGTAHSLVQQSNPRSCSSQQQAAWFAPWTKSIGVGWDSLQHPLSITSIMALPLAKGSYRQHLAGRVGCDAADTSSRAPVIRQAQANSSRNQAKTRAATAGDRPHTRPASASGPTVRVRYLPAPAAATCEIALDPIGRHEVGVCPDGAKTKSALEISQTKEGHAEVCRVEVSARRKHARPAQAQVHRR